MKLYPVDHEPNTRARLTGEYRAPKKGEYFLASNSHVKRATSDLAGEYFMCRIIRRPRG